MLLKINMSTMTVDYDLFSFNQTNNSAYVRIDYISDDFLLLSLPTISSRMSSDVNTVIFDSFILLDIPNDKMHTLSLSSDLKTPLREVENRRYLYKPTNYSYLHTNYLSSDIYDIKCVSEDCCYTNLAIDVKYNEGVIVDSNIGAKYSKGFKFKARLSNPLWRNTVSEL